MSEQFPNPSTPDILRAFGYPEGAEILDDEVISVINGKVHLHGPAPTEEQLAYFAQQQEYEWQQQQQYAQQQEHIPQPGAEVVPRATFRLEVQGPIEDLVRFSNGQFGGGQVVHIPQGAPHYLAQNYAQPEYQATNYGQYEQPYNTNQGQPTYEAEYTDPEPEIIAEEPFYEEEFPQRGILDAYTPSRDVTQDGSWSFINDQEAARYEEVQDVKPEKRRVSKRWVIGSAAVVVALASGPAVQAMNRADEAVAICADEGILDIMGNPGCFGEQFAGEFTKPENLFNYIPKEHEPKEKK